MSEPKTCWECANFTPYENDDEGDGFCRAWYESYGEDDPACITFKPKENDDERSEASE